MIFVDTSAFYAIEVEDDVNHEKAISFLMNRVRKGEFGTMITSDYVINETLTLLRLRHGVREAWNFYSKITRSKVIRVIWVDEVIFNEALSFFRKNKKYKWSFTDCTSFAIMKLLNIKYAFTFDKNFEEAGFVKLP